MIEVVWQTRAAESGRFRQTGDQIAMLITLQDQIEQVLYEADLVGEGITREIQTVEYGAATICGEYVQGIYVTCASAQDREGDIDYSDIHAALRAKDLGVRDAVYLPFTTFFVAECVIDDSESEVVLSLTSWN